MLQPVRLHNRRLQSASYRPHSLVVAAVAPQRNARVSCQLQRILARQSGIFRYLQLGCNPALVNDVRDQAREPTDGARPMRIEIDAEELKPFVEKVVREVLEQTSWPVGRVALTEAEAADALGVPRHTLRDWRLSGRSKVTVRKVGNRVLYTREDLFRLLQLGVQ